MRDPPVAAPRQQNQNILYCFHTLSKLYDVPVGFVPPPHPILRLNIVYFRGRRRVAVARYRMICLALISVCRLKGKCRVDFYHFLIGTPKSEATMG